MREQDLGSTIREMLALQTAVEYVQLYFQKSEKHNNIFFKTKIQKSNTEQV